MIYIGVDPGVSGAIAVLEAPSSPFGVRLRAYVCMTNLYRNVNGSKLKRLDVPHVTAILRSNAEAGRTMLVCEQALTIPGMGVMSRVSLGRCEGAMEAIAASHGWRFEAVHPSRWHKLIPGSVAVTDWKDAAVDFAGIMFPEVTDDILWSESRARREGIADAICIALWAARENGERVRWVGGSEPDPVRVESGKSKKKGAKKS